MGWEYLHWIDLRLIKLMEAVISKIYLTKNPFLSKQTFLGSKKRSKNVQKGPTAPTQISWTNKKSKGVGKF